MFSLKKYFVLCMTKQWSNILTFYWSKPFFLYSNHEMTIEKYYLWISLMPWIFSLLITYILISFNFILLLFICQQIKLASTWSVIFVNPKVSNGWNPEIYNCFMFHCDTRERSIGYFLMFQHSWGRVIQMKKLYRSSLTYDGVIMKKLINIWKYFKWKMYLKHLVYLVEKEMANHSSTLAWNIPWTEEPGRLQSMGSLRVRHHWATSLSLFTFMHWRRKWQPTPVFLPRESPGRGSLVGCRLWGRTTEVT